MQWGFEFFKKKWFSIFNLKACLIEDTEINKRITFSQDPDVDASKERKKKLLQYATLKYEILNTNAYLPEWVTEAALKLDSPINNDADYLLNVHSRNGVKATGVYIGLATKGDAFIIRKSISDMFLESQQGKLVIIWYRNPLGILLKEIEEQVKPSFMENVSVKSNSFRKTRN